eukprot:3150079-Amphidinium_carterae.1
MQRAHNALVCSQALSFRERFSPRERLHACVSNGYQTRLKPIPLASSSLSGSLVLRHMKVIQVGTSALIAADGLHYFTCDGTVDLNLEMRYWRARSSHNHRPHKVRAPSPASYIRVAKLAGPMTAGGGSIWVERERESASCSLDACPA